MRLHHHGLPSGSGLLLIHGLSSSHRVWRHNLAALGERHRLLIVELFARGGGARFRLSDQAERLAESLEDEPEPVAVMGHSLGGLVAMELAARRPDLVERLVLVDVPALPPADPLPARLRGLARPTTVSDARSVGVVARTILEANPLQLLAATAASVRSNLASAATAIPVSTLVVWGSDDAIVPVEIARRLVQLIPDARLELVKGAGHQPQWEAPDAFHAAVLPFLAES
jgi:pimeloyl-ACP methyl ester carboxylesterase